MSFIIGNLSGSVPGLDVWTQYTIQSVSFTASSYTITSTALTGLAKNIGFVFGGYAAFKPAKTINYNKSVRPVGFLQFPRFAFYPSGAPHQGIRVQLFDSSFTASSYTIVSTALTGLSKNIGFVFGGYGAAKQPKEYIRYWQLNGSWTCAMALDCSLTGYRPGLFIGCALTCDFNIPPSTEVLEIDMALDCAFTITGAAQFRCNMAMTCQFEPASGASFECVMALDVDFVGKGGQMSDCVLGGGVVIEQPPVDTNYVF